MKWILIFLICLADLSVLAQFKNIKLLEEDGTGTLSEASIAISNKNRSNMVVGIGPNRAVFTLDSGKTWTESQLKSTFGVEGNPAVISDHKGHFYYLHRADPAGQGKVNEGWHDRIVSQRSEDGGKTWEGAVSIGNNPPKDQDYQWVAVHPKKQIIYTAWTQFDTYGLQDTNCQSYILFSMSTNAGGKWGKPVQISQTPGDCQDGDNTAMGAIPAVAMDGRIYVSWSNQGVIFLDRSYDGGVTWLSNDLGIAKQPGGSSMKIPGIKRANGKPVLMVNTSLARTQGNLYIVFADQRNGENDTDIWFIRSVSRGDNWTSALKINKDGPGKHQFMPWLTVDEITGTIYIVYYDRRSYEDLQTDVYLAFSIDGGNTFEETKISESPFIPDETLSLADHTSIAAHDGVIVPVWTRMDGGKKSIWTSIISEKDLRKLKEPAKK